MTLLGTLTVDKPNTLSVIEVCVRLVLTLIYVFFFSSRRRHTRSLCDWSSDVCSSDLSALGLPKHWVGDNYISIVATARFWQMLWNSAVIATFTVVLTLLVSSLAAYTLAHLRFAGRKWIANYLTLGLTFPFATAVLPVFIRVRDLGLLDTYWGVILPQVA